MSNHIKVSLTDLPSLQISASNHIHVSLTDLPSVSNQIHVSLTDLPSVTHFPSCIGPLTKYCNMAPMGEVPSSICFVAGISRTRS